MIGTGASAVQFIPEIAPSAGELLVFQRTPPWLGPTPEYHDAVPTGHALALRARAVVQRVEPLLDLLADGRRRLAGVRVDPDWDEPNGASVSAVNDIAAQMLAAYLEGQFADRPDLVAKVIPDYPPGAKRVLRDNGVWARTLQARQRRARSPTPIREITPSGVVTADGVEHDVDVIVYGTGFQASKFLTPMTVHRPRRRRPPRAVGRRRARLPRHHRARASRTCSASTGRTPTS